MDCIFCKIINEDIKSYTVYEDELVKVFLDINPNTNGHMLLVPKKHYNNIMDLDESLTQHIHTVIKHLYGIIKDKLGCVGLTICQNNDFGQEVKHIHFHLIPRYSNDEFKITKNDKILVNIEDVYEQLKD